MIHSDVHPRRSFARFLGAASFCVSLCASSAISHAQSNPYGPALVPPPALGQGYDQPSQPGATAPAYAPPAYQAPPSQQPVYQAPIYQAPPFQPPAYTLPQQPAGQFGQPAQPFGAAPQNPGSYPTTETPAPALPSPSSPGPTFPPAFGQPSPPPGNAPIIQSGPQAFDAPRAGTRSTTISALGDTAIQAAPTIASWGEFTDAQIIGRVGGESILAGDVMGTVNRALEPYREQMTAQEFDEQKLKATKAFLQQLIETKVIYADAMAKIPAENLSKMRNAVNEQFEKNIVKSMMERYKVESRVDLESKLKTTGSSLEKQSQMFFERSVANQWMKQSIKPVENISLAELLAYYKNHQADYEFKAQVRWEELMVDFTKISDKPTAYRTLAEWGNMVFGGGPPFADVAKQFSQGPTGYKGGAYDWTTQGSLRSEVLEQAIHALPVGQLSQILEDESGLHIVRVVERKAAGRIPFEEAQPEIKKKLLEEANKKIEDVYLAKVKTRVAVWTLYGGDVAPEEMTLGNGTQKKR